MSERRPVLVNEIDRVLAECRAIAHAIRDGYSDAHVVQATREPGVWRIELELTR